MIDDFRCGELPSKVITCANFEFDVSIESRAIVFDGTCRDALFAVFCDDVGEAFGGSVDACEGVQTESRKVVLYVVGEGGPVSSFVVSKGAFRWGGVWAVESVFDQEREVV